MREHNQGLRARLAATAGAAVFASTLAGCSPARLVSMITPTDGIRAVHSVAYGAHPRQQLDVYQPTAAMAERPVVVFFYGGRWARGHRRDYLFAAQALVGRGYVAVVPDYRLYPEVRFPQFVSDGAAATAWTLANIAAFGGDPGRVYVMGHSSGAHIAALLALDERYLESAGNSGQVLAGMIGLAGPYDFLPLTASDLKKIFGPPDRYAASQPVNFVDGDEPALLLLHGSEDKAVWPRNTERLAARVRAAGGRVSAHIYPDLGHVGIVGALARAFRHWAPVLDDVTRFIEAGGTPASVSARLELAVDD